ncbi:hypothetical protein UA08_05231 [Talaromyces atroroseus]|uniref:Uncharacterized protein n=1 Tax=Talaromyces atroroseus TaxID=1441469 RepID=A0A225ADL8_TALAT|nr:hypothetical protein UA08_05231 [Talaromyces atroroseus]OKL59272.1 hypothetical protein UA08_05231 [Talaromyces atroroseus]
MSKTATTGTVIATTMVVSEDEDDVVDVNRVVVIAVLEEEEGEGKDHEDSDVGAHIVISVKVVVNAMVLDSPGSNFDTVPGKVICVDSHEVPFEQIERRLTLDNILLLSPQMSVKN